MMLHAMDRTLGRAGLVVAALLLALLTFPAASGATTVTLGPSGDTFVRADSPGTNFGTDGFLDSHGGTATYTCGADLVTHVGPSYGYLKFDLSSIPAGAKIDGVDLQLTSRTGFAWDGDGFQHIRFVADDDWSEGDVTYASQPSGVDPTFLASTGI